jgi:hypothetical protein
MEVDYNILLVQNHVHDNYVVQKSPYGVVVQWLKTWLLTVKARSLSPHTCNLGYLGYLGNLIKQPRFQILLVYHLGYLA